MKTIRIYFLVILFLYIEQAGAQIFCPTPEIIMPTFSYESVDPPILAWHPVTFTGTCTFYVIQFYTCNMCGGPACYLTGFTFGSGQDTIYYMDNSMWSGFPLYEPFYWVVRVGVGSPLYGVNPCAPLIRLPAALPPVTLIFPPNGATNEHIMPLLRWSRLESASSYRVRISDDPIFESVVLDLVTDTVDLQVPEGILTQNTIYWWKVKPYKTGGEGPFSDVFHFTTFDIYPPPAPILGIPPNNSVGQLLNVFFGWNTTPYTDRYRIQLALDSSFINIVFEDFTIEPFITVTDLSILTKYYWRVRGEGFAGSGPWSSVWNFKTMGTPSQVTLLLPPNNAVNVPTSYTFRWSRAYDQTTHFMVTDYWFDMVTDTVSMANLLRDSTLADTSKEVTEMSYNTSYYWRVKAKNQIGWGNFAPWFKFTTIPAAPSVPILIAPPNDAVGQSLTPKLDWTVTATAMSYRVQVSLDSAFVTTLLDSITVVDSLTVPVNVLINNTRYYWRVNASNAGGISLWSTVWHFNTLLVGSSNYSGEIPKEFKLYNNYPNPFNPVTKIRFDIAPDSRLRGNDNVTLIVFDVLGRIVSVLVNQQLKPGTYEAEFYGTNYPSGIYFYKLETETFTQTKRMVLIK